MSHDRETDNRAIGISYSLSLLDCHGNDDDDSDNIDNLSDCIFHGSIDPQYI